MLQENQTEHVQLRNNLYRLQQDVDRPHASFQFFIQRVMQVELVATRYNPGP